MDSLKNQVETRTSLLLAAVAIAGGTLAVHAGQRLPILPRPEPLALTNANVVNVSNGSIQSNVTVIVRATRIESIGAGAPPTDAKVLDIGGAYLLPGLIDGHTHLADVASAKRALQAGITAVRSAGVPGATPADVGLRELARNAHVAAPDMFAAGYMLRPQLPVDVFLLKPDYAALEGGLNTVERVRQVVRMNLEQRVDWIKMMVTAGIGTDPEKLQFTRDQVVAVVREAGKIPVAAHAFSDDGVRIAVEAGVRSIEHGQLASEATLDLMKRHGTFLVPTTDVILNAGDRPAPPGFDAEVIRRNFAVVQPKGRETLRQARKIGVKIVAGTDFGYSSSARGIAGEIANFVQLGFTPLEALRSATTIAAEMLDRERSIGRIERGYEADLIAVRGNPLTDVSVLSTPVLVISNGRIALNSF